MKIFQNILVSIYTHINMNPIYIGRGGWRTIRAIIDQNSSDRRIMINCLASQKIYIRK